VGGRRRCLRRSRLDHGLNLHGSGRLAQFVERIGRRVQGTHQIADEPDAGRSQSAGEQQTMRSADGRIQRSLHAKPRITKKATSVGKGDRNGAQVLRRARLHARFRSPSAATSVRPKARIPRSGFIRRRLIRGDEGQVLVFSVLALTVIFAFSAFAIDMGQLVVARHRAQLAADSGALAGAADFPTHTTSIAGDATTFANDNVPGGTVTVSEPQGMSGTQVQVKVSQPVPLAFGSLFNINTGNVSANAVAKDQANAAQIADGDVSPVGCSNIQSNPATGLCEYYANQGSPLIGNANPPTTPGWTTTSSPGNSSVDIQGCNGSVPNTSCTDPNGAPINDDVIDLNGWTAGGMWQTVTTVAGGYYILTFELTGNPAGFSCAWDTFTGNVQITDAITPYATLASQSFTHTDQCSGNVETANFQTVTVAFAATSSSTKITFNSTTDTQSTLLAYQPLHIADVNDQSPNMYVDDSGVSTTPGANVQQWSGTGAWNQQWAFVPVSGNYGELKLNCCSGTLDIQPVNGETTQGHQDMVTATVNGSAAQLWDPVQEGDGSWSFINKNSGLCLDVYGGTTQGAQMDQWPCKYEPNAANGNKADNQDFTVAGGNVCGSNGSSPCVYFGPEVTGINVDYSSAALIQ
jgi:Flp pilus assembly protein TadG